MTGNEYSKKLSKKQKKFLKKEKKRMKQLMKIMIATTPRIVSLAHARSVLLSLERIAFVKPTDIRMVDL